MASRVGKDCGFLRAASTRSGRMRPTSDSPVSQACFVGTLDNVNPETISYHPKNHESRRASSERSAIHSIFGSLIRILRDMTDPRWNDLAMQLAGYSLELEAGENVLVDLIDIPDGFAIALIRAIRERGATPFVESRRSRIQRELLMGVDAEQAALAQKIELNRMKKMQAYIAIRGAANSSETTDVPSENMAMFSRTMRPVLNQRVNHCKWVVLRWPSPSMAQSAAMSTEAFEDFYFKVCNLDYAKMAKAMVPLQQRMEAAKEVHITGPGTDLRFSIEGIAAVPCKGDRNIPDGEVFSCPIKNSVEGVLQYNTPTIYAGSRFENVRLVFSKGKIVEATCNDDKRLNEILDTDKGARYIGEFSLGLNPYILNPMNDILFDEKITGSFHFTPGQAYESADNGNRSAVHWDMVCIQRKEWGGGEIYFDGELIRKDGIFKPKDLRNLNPDKLAK